MADDYGQHFGWDAQPAGFQHPVPGASNDYQIFGQLMSPNFQLWVCNTSIQVFIRGGVTAVTDKCQQSNYSTSQYTRPDSFKHSETVTAPELYVNLFSPPAGLKHVPASETALASQASQCLKLEQTSGSPLAVDMSEKRRQQNRTSQFAFRPA